MRAVGVASRASDIAARQWGLLTTAQAQLEGLSRLQLARLTDAGVLERIDQGVYAVPSNIDEHTNLRAAWLTLDPTLMAEDRLNDPISSGVVSHASAATLHGLGDLPADTPEFTVASRKQSRRAIRLHRSPLEKDEVTLSHGLPATTPARTAADLLCDGQDPTHVAQIAGEALQQGLATRQELSVALEPLASKFSQPNGSALLEHLLDLVGLSAVALREQLASSSLGKSLVAAGQLDAVQRVGEALSQLVRDSAEPVFVRYREVAEKLGQSIQAGLLAQATQLSEHAASQLKASLLPQVQPSSVVAIGDLNLLELTRRAEQLEEHSNAGSRFPQTRRDPGDG